MRLQSEEQNEQVMSRMVLTQKQLEQQIRNLTGKGKPAREITTTVNGTNMQATTAGGLSSNAITPIDSAADITAQEGENDTFADFVKDSSTSVANPSML